MLKIVSHSHISKALIIYSIYVAIINVDSKLLSSKVSLPAVAIGFNCIKSL